MTEIILENLKMVGLFLIPFVCTYLANTILGIANNVHTVDDWDWRLFMRGLVKGVSFAFGIGLATIAFAMLPELLGVFNIDLVNADFLSECSVVFIIATIITTTYKVYGKQVIEKIKSFCTEKEVEVSVGDNDA